MIFLESSHFYLRVVVFDFVNPKEYPNFVIKLIPTIHIGSEEFYNNVIDEINTCDELLFEGVEMHPPAEDELSDEDEDENGDPVSEFGSYHNMAKKLNLTTEYKMIKLSELKPKLIHADLSYSESSKEISKLKVLERFKFSIIPLSLRILSLYMTRQKFAKAMRQGAELSARKRNPWTDGEEGSIGNFLMNSRDGIVIKLLEKKLAEKPDKQLTIGVVYGAAHMEQISRYLIDKKKFSGMNGRYLKVFDMTK